MSATVAMLWLTVFIGIRSGKAGGRKIFLLDKRPIFDTEPNRLLSLTPC